MMTTNEMIETILLFGTIFIFIKVIEFTITSIKDYMKMHKQFVELKQEMIIGWKVSKDDMKEHDPELYKKIYDRMQKLKLDIDEK